MTLREVAWLALCLVAVATTCAVAYVELTAPCDPGRVDCACERMGGCGDDR